MAVKKPRKPRITDSQWEENARNYIMQVTKRQTPLQAINYFSERLNGPREFVELVAKAMKGTFFSGWENALAELENLEGETTNVEPKDPNSSE